jgi:hypothetical protein
MPPAASYTERCMVCAHPIGSCPRLCFSYFLMHTPLKRIIMQSSVTRIRNIFFAVFISYFLDPILVLNIKKNMLTSYLLNYYIIKTFIAIFHTKWNTALSLKPDTWLNGIWIRPNSHTGPPHGRYRKIFTLARTEKNHTVGCI